MKYLFLAFITLTAMASNWVPESKIQSHSSQAYQLESECLKSGELCFDVGDEPEIVSAGFASVSESELVTDEEGFLAYKAGKLQQSNMAAALAAAKKIRNCGESVIDLILVRNQAKGLSTSQVKIMVGTYAPIQGLLTSGSLVSAKEEILNVTADGVLVTEGDKTALAARIDECLAL